MTIRKLNHSQAFTIVELLIVIVVIAILAAITVVAYNGIQNRSKDSAAASAATQAAKKIAIWQVDNPGVAPPTLADAGVTNSANATFQYTRDTGVIPNTFCITASNGGRSSMVTSTSTATTGSCGGHSASGTITNYHMNPGATTASWYGNYPGASGNVTSASVVAAPWSESGSAYRGTWTTVTNANDGDIQVSLANGRLTAGQRYTLRYKIRSGQTSQITAPTLYASTGSYTTIARSHNSNLTLASNTPVVIWITFEADSTSLGAGLRSVMGPRSNVANNYFELSEAVIYDGDYNSSYGFMWASSPGWQANSNSTSSGPPL